MSDDARYSTPPAPCHNCDFAAPESIPGLEDMSLVTSDCRPWNGRRSLTWCPCCGLVQKRVDQDFHDDCCRIYGSYTVYHQSGGQEQKTFSTDGAGMARSEHLLRGLLDRTPLADSGRLLDVGCGNGVLLKSFGALKPGWRLCGLDLDDRSRNVVKALPGVEDFYSCDLTQVPGQFDMVSMMHCLEHVPAPVEFLRKTAALMAPGGLLLIEVPDFSTNPFDLAIADHCSHFAPETLEASARRAGFEPVLLERGLVSKELTLLARLTGETDEAYRIADSREVAARAINWMRSTLAAAREIPAAELGIFGTSIAGVWLFNCLEGKAAFFVDEDLSRVGHTLFGLPVVSSSDLRAGQTVFLSIPPQIAKTIIGRMAQSPARFALPPDL
ncbi:MAG: class I SAM-dependent methyltransferase [Humidesulfovibrio sp.]|nr:class I SAM-dependent methyltransferase [Humidesulfovibrio sp.]